MDVITKVVDVKNRKLVYEDLPDTVSVLMYEYIEGKFNKTLRLHHHEIPLYVLEVHLRGV